MNFHFDPKDLSPFTRLVIFVLIYLEGVFAGLLGILSSLVRMAWGITWPVLARPVRHVWPAFGWYMEYGEQQPWGAVHFYSANSGKGYPFEICRRSADCYVITWDGWLIELFTSDFADKLLRRWVPTEAELEAAEAQAALLSAERG